MRACALTLCAFVLAGCATGHAGAVVDVAFSPDGRHVATTSLDRTVQVRDVESGVLLATLEVEGGVAPTAAAFAGEGRVVAHDGGGALRVFDVAREVEIARLPAPPATAIAVSPDAGRVALIEEDAATVIELESGKTAWSASLRSATPVGLRSAQRRVAFDGDGGRLFVARVATTDGLRASPGRHRSHVEIDVLDARTGDELRSMTLPAAPLPVVSVEFLSDVRGVLIGRQGRPVVGVDLATMADMGLFYAVPFRAELRVRASAIAPGGKWRIAGLEDGTVQGFNPAAYWPEWSAAGR